MSQEFTNWCTAVHRDIATTFAAGNGSVKRHVEVRIATGKFYVYLYENGAHVQTQMVDIPEKWLRRWPSDAQVRFFLRRHCQLGEARITTLAA